MNLRMDKAKGLLKKGYKVYEVSEMVGYNNHRYFTDIFKKYTGETPKNYQDHVYHQDAERKTFCVFVKKVLYTFLFFVI